MSEGSIKRLDILSGKPSVLAVWLSYAHVIYIDLQTGQQKSSATLDALDVRERGEATWRPFVESLRASNHTFFPYVRGKHGAIYNSGDGSKRLYYLGGRDLVFESAGEESRLDFDMPDDAASGKATKSDDTPLVAVGLDRAGSGMSAALDARARLTLFKDRVAVGTFPLPLTIDDEMRPVLLVARGNTTAIVTDGRRVVVVDSSGRVRAQTDLYFTIGAMNCSSDGKRVIFSDLDANLIRVYTSSGLVATHQRFAVDLLAEARRAQTEPIPEAGRAALGAVAINSKGVVAFSVAGTLCVTSLARLSSIPRSAV